MDKEEFYAALEAVIEEYNIREEDLCVWDNNNNPIPDVSGSFERCQTHLEESFLLGTLPTDPIF